LNFSIDRPIRTVSVIDYIFFNICFINKFSIYFESVQKWSNDDAPADHKVKFTAMRWSIVGDDPDMDCCYPQAKPDQQ